MRNSAWRRMGMALAASLAVLGATLPAPSVAVHAASSAGCPFMSPGDPNNTTSFSPPSDWLPSTGPAYCTAVLHGTAQVSGAASARPLLDSTGSNWVADVHLRIYNEINNTLLASCDASTSVPAASIPESASCSVGTVILDSTGQPTTENVRALCTVEGDGLFGEYYCTLQQ